MNQKPLNPITAQDIAQFQADGVVCLRGMFDSEWISRMQKAVDRIMDADLPVELDAVDRLVIAYTKIAWETPNRVTQRMHDALLEHFSEALIVELTLRITLCGFFNRFNDALRIEEEEEAHAALAAVEAH